MTKLSPLPEGAAAALGLPIETPPSLPSVGVAPLDTPRGKVWVKRPEPPTKRYRRTALTYLSKILPIPILRPAAHGKGANTLVHQAQQADRLRASGLPVADVLFASPDCLILADAGANIEKAMRGINHDPDSLVLGDVDKQALHTILLQMTQTLADLHSKGLAHGRPKIRDFGWTRAGQIGDGKPTDGIATLLDLEERPWEVMPMAAAQARDIFLWLTDLCSRDASRDIALAAMTVFDRTMTGETRGELRKLRRLLSVAAPPVRLIAKTPLRNREVTGSLGAYDVLRTQTSS